MTSRSRPLALVGLLVLVGFALAAPERVPAQDRGAPLFGPGTTADSVTAEASDAGRLWSLATPPFERFRERYDVEADSAWATHLRRGIVRLPNCTAALVSSEGLAVTTDRCVRRHLSTGDQTEAFVAGQDGSERPIDGLTADRLVGLRDVTEEVRDVRQTQTVSSAEAARIVEKRLQASAGSGRRVSVAAVAGGTQAEAYTYRRYDDVRLVFRPERAVSDFGDLDAHLSYPHYNLDVALVRIYGDGGRPLSPAHHFEVSSQEPRPGGVVFSVGHSSNTMRAETADQLALYRDVILPFEIDRREAQTEAIEAHVSSVESPAERWQEALSTGLRALKQHRAERQALQSEYLMARLERRDRSFRTSIQVNSELGTRYGGLLDSIAAIQKSKRELASAYGAFGGLAGSSMASGTLRRALWATLASRATGAEADSLRARARAVAPQPAEIDAGLLAARLRALQAYYGTDSEAARRLLNGFPPAQRASDVVGGSALAEGGSIASGGGDALANVPPDDPALAIVEVFADEFVSFDEEWRALAKTENRLARRLAGARRAVQTRPVLPAGSGAPRLTDGRLLGYPYNGTQAPAFTTFYGLYGQNRAFGASSWWALPQRWDEASGDLDRSTPLLRAASTDPAAGTNGAPLLDRHLQIVGVVGGTNIQGPGSAFLFLPERMRTVAVGMGALDEALRFVYRAEGLANELSDVSAEAPEASR